MDTSKKLVRRNTRKTIAGIKLPPLEATSNSDIKTIVDVDPSFYSLIEGRPIRPNPSIQKYKQNIKEVAIKQTLHGFLIDEILRIDKEIAKELEIFETASLHFNEYQNSFDKFLAHDNDKTIAVMKKSDSLAKELATKTEEQKKVMFEMATLKSKLQYTEETLSILLSFQKFLFKASPILWQKEQNINIDKIRQEILPKNTDIYSKIDIDSVKQKLSELPSLHLYFETSDQLLTAFTLLEKQNLNYLLATEELNSEKNRYLKALDCLKKLLMQELSFIEEKIKEIKEDIKMYEDRENELKETFFDILETKIKFLVSSELVLQIFNYVEFAYLQLIASNETNLSSLDMALALENEYDSLQLHISTFNLEMIKEIEKETYESGDKELKQAIEATKLLKDVDKLNRRLKSSYEPSRRMLRDFDKKN